MTTSPRSLAPPGGHYPAVKRCLDFLGAMILLVLLAPLLLLLAAIVVLDSRGPAIYSQIRVGRGTRHFTIYKYRTMRIGTPVLSTEEMLRQRESPFTRIGPWLRRTSLDELPQLLNVLRGEMSFIGPRPALPSQTDVNQLREHYGVHLLRPGITGLAQVMGRDDLETEIKVGYDREYAREISARLDLRILLRTMSAVLSGRGNH